MGTETRLSDTEIAAEVTRKYGYLVFAWEAALKPGSIIKCDEVAGAQALGQHFAVIAETTRGEYDEHNDYIEFLQGDPPSGPDRDLYPHYYRVTTD